jgi:apolipoprotein N-acyltransferase
VGAVILSAFLLWLGELALTAFRKKGRLGSGDWGSVTLCLLALLYGAVRVQAIEGIISNSPKVVVGVVQGNLGVFEKRDIDAFAENLAQYRTLSQQAVQAGAELLLWPESVVNRPVLESSPRFSGTELCPLGADGELKTPLLYGGLSVRKRSPDELEKLRATAPATPSPYKLFNTAFGVDAECAVVGRYHKRILMPFGEYMPFASLFPQVKALSPQTGEFDFGDLTQPIVFEMSDRRVKATTLICYEDLVPALSQRGTAKERGNLLVNLTNDAWYGETAAPYQHHLLALWRAIETRRFLIRATNTGYTAVVDPLGRTVTSLPIFQAGYFVHPVGLIDDVTVFARWGGRLQRLLLQIIALTVVFSWKRRQRAP